MGFKRDKAHFRAINSRKYVLVIMEFDVMKKLCQEQELPQVAYFTQHSLGFKTYLCLNALAVIMPSDT